MRPRPVAGVILGEPGHITAQLSRLPRQKPREGTGPSSGSSHSRGGNSPAGRSGSHRSAFGQQTTRGSRVGGAAPKAEQQHHQHQQRET